MHGLDVGVPADRQFAELLADDQLRLRAERWAAFLGPRGPRYRECSFSNFEVSGDRAREKELALETVREYASDFRAHFADGNSLLLYGPTGTGKDHLAVAAIKRGVFETGEKAHWINAQELFADFRDAIDNGKGRSEGEAIRGAATPPMLLLSDPLPATGELSDFNRSILYRLIDARYCAKRPTVVTINIVDGEEALRRLGAATWDRLRHNARCVPCFWPTYRRPDRGTT